MRIGFSEILLILVIVLVVFGGGKISGVGKALGQSIREFKKELNADKESGEQDASVRKENEEKTDDGDGEAS